MKKLNKGNVPVETAEQFSSLWQNLGPLHCAPCCTAGSFQIDISGTPASPWNKSASKVFANSFIHTEGLSPNQETMDKVIAAFNTRIRYEQRKYKINLLPDAAKEKMMSNHRREQRVYCVSCLNSSNAQILTRNSVTMTGSLLYLQTTNLAPMPLFSAFWERMGCQMMNWKMRAPMHTAGVFESFEYADLPGERIL